MAEVTRLIGQARAETLLARALRGDRISHAYLFLGPPDSGKSTAALLFAQAADCERQPAVLADGVEPGRLRLAPCGECESCRRVGAETHPEVLVVTPGSKTGQNITVEQAREIRRNASLRPKLGRRRFYLIPQAEAFNEESANALLKTLEEPSDFVTLILCAPNPSQVLPTIRSRCQIVRFGLAPAAEIETALTTRGTTPEIAAALARACGGRPGLALTWAEEPAVLKTRRTVLDVFAQALALQEEARRGPEAGVHALRLGEQLRGLVIREKEEGARPPKAQLQEHLEVGQTLLRDVLILTQQADSGLAQNQERIGELIELARSSAPDAIIARVGAVREAQQLLERNVTPQLVLERMFWALICGPVPKTAALFEEQAA
jgi:DNA polymerase-3 subunit delta'